MDRIKTDIKDNIQGEIDVSCNCKICGKPIVQSNFYGMYCENMCGLEDDKKAFDKLNGMFGGMFSNIYPNFKR